MPTPRIVDQLDEEDRLWLDELLRANNFTRFQDIADAFNERMDAKGLELRITKSSVYRYGKKFEEQIDWMKQTAEMAKLLHQHYSDDEGEVSGALINLANDKLFRLVLTENLDPKTLSTLSRAIADISRAAVVQKKHAIKVRSDQLEKVAAETAATARKEGLSEAAVNTIVTRILGVNDAGSERNDG